jgi:hypothetical protein
MVAAHGGLLMAAKTDTTVLSAMALCGLTGPTWAPWRVVGKVLDGLSLDAEEQHLYEQCTGRTRLPAEPPSEFYAICGRRSGKSRFASVSAIRAASRRYHLAPGERAIVGVAASDRTQAKILYDYASEPFRDPAGLRGPVHRGWQALAQLVTRRTRWALDLQAGVSLEVRTADYGTIRGKTYALVVADELAFWSRDDGTNPATEVLNAVCPGLATLNGQLLGISSPFAKSGPLWDVYDRYFGRDDDRVLVWRAPSRVMDPSLPERVVLDALERDEASARSEWLGEFRDDLSGYVTSEALRACVDSERTADTPVEVGPAIEYMAFVDPATGSGQDSMTCAIAHTETRDDRVVAIVDAVGEARPPFDPEAEVQSICTVLGELNITSIIGDAFAKGWVSAPFGRRGVHYELSIMTKTELYLGMLHLINSRQVRLPDHPRLLAQLSALQRRIGHGGGSRLITSAVLARTTIKPTRLLAQRSSPIAGRPHPASSRCLSNALATRTPSSS